MDVLRMCSWYAGKATVYICCHLLHGGAVSVCLVSRNLGERAGILSSVMAPRERDDVLGEMWTYSCLSLQT